jgi:hypothetical protein
MVRFEEEAVKASELPERIAGRSRVVCFGFLKQGNSYLSRVPMLGGETDTASEPHFITDPMADVALRRVGEDLEVILVAKAAGRFELHVDERDLSIEAKILGVGCGTPLLRGGVTCIGRGALVSESSDFSGFS